MRIMCWVILIGAGGCGEREEPAPVECDTLGAPIDDTSTDTADSVPPSDDELAELPPIVVQSVPQYLNMSVNPELDALEITFSKDMGPGYSWVSVAQDSTPEVIGDPVWLSARVQRLPVRLEPGKTYALSVNGPSYNGFVDTSGAPAAPFTLVFRTSSE
jgi:hypothetical protein